MFRTIDPVLWHATWHNPIELLQRVDPARLAACAKDAEFLRQYDGVEQAFRRHLESPDTWFSRANPGSNGPIAYFSAEFGLHNSVPIYSGGLGVLAGDYCKAASDLGIPLVGVGLLYTRGYFDQRVRLDGLQEDSDERFDPAITPLSPVLGPDGEPNLVVVRTCGRDVHVGAWRMMVGRVALYLLDTDLERNEPIDRELTHKLYAGGELMRLRQEWILGVGGVRVLRAVGVTPVAWHANEGHAAFMFVERLRELIQIGKSMDEAVQDVRVHSAFTTHTPVPAGHDMFTREQLNECVGPLWEELHTSPERFFGLGFHPQRDGQSFHMTAVAIRLSSHVNAVSARHERESRRIWHDLWPDRPVDEVPIGHVTNGVHLPTWMADPLKALLDEDLGADWMARAGDPELWNGVLAIDDLRLWTVHQQVKWLLMDFLHEEARRRWREYWDEARHLIGAGTLLTARDMTIGFARRFATYKRADLIFRDPERLLRLLTNPLRPVQLLFAGKAHPADQPGKEMLQRVYGFTRDPRFEGRVAFIEDYELHAAHSIVQGVDLWLNLPRPPMEASGTSGMKAALNGIPQLGTPDGWWAEGYSGLNGWALPLAPEDADVDAHDAEQLYSLLEEQVVPLFYTRDHRGIPMGWVQRMKHALLVAGQRFTATRMAREYVDRYYHCALRGDPSEDAPPTV